MIEDPQEQPVSPPLEIPPPRSAWRDRFRTPTVNRLVGLLKPEEQPMAVTAIEKLERTCVCKPGVAWLGECWRWVIEFRPRVGREPIAVIIPNPQDLQLAAPLPREFILSLSTRRMKRSVRDGLELAFDPFDTNWAVWPILGVNMLDDILDLIKQRASFASETEDA